MSLLTFREAFKRYNDFINEQEENDEKKIELLRNMIKDLFLYMSNRINLNKKIKIVLKKDKTNAQDPLGNTANFNPDKNIISLFITNRHPKDILRSLAHELVHVSQHAENRVPPGHSTENGYAQNDKVLRKLEKEAYEKGNILFRDWEDEQKEGKGTNEVKNRVEQNRQDDLMVWTNKMGGIYEGEKK